MEAAVKGPAARPSPRNASIMVPLRAAAGAAGAGGQAGAGGGEGPAASASRFLLHGGWRPFVVTYNDTYVVTVTEAGPA